MSSKLQKITTTGTSQMPSMPTDALACFHTKLPVRVIQEHIKAFIILLATAVGTGGLLQAQELDTITLFPFEVTSEGDIGFEAALLDWVRKHRSSWKASRPVNRASNPRTLEPRTAIGGPEVSLPFLSNLQCK